MRMTDDPLRADNWGGWSDRMEGIDDDEGCTLLVNGEETEPKPEVEALQLARGEPRHARTRAITL
jgi:hypothetical protein